MPEIGGTVTKTLYVSDLDFTLLGSDATLHPDVTEKLNRLLGQGLLFTIATARSYEAIKKILLGLRLNIPIIEGNGAIVRDFQSGEVLRAFAIDTCEGRPAIDALASIGIVPCVTAANGRDQTQYVGQDLNVPMRAFFEEKQKLGFKDVQMADWDQTFWDRKDQHVLRLTFLDDKETIERAAAAVLAAAPTLLVKVFYVKYWDCWELLVTSRNANKGNTLLHLKSIVQERRAQKVSKLVTFGDAVNDLEMSEVADLAISVEHVDDEIKARADQIIGARPLNPPC